MKPPCFFFFFLFLLFFSWRISAQPICGDFLAMSEKKPPQLEYLDCTEGKDAQLRVWRARYRVAGRYARQVEDYLVKETGMQPLSHVCCIWEPIPMNGNRYGYIPHKQWPDGSPESRDTLLTYYEISMGSEESLINQREKWHAIDWFYVDVTFFLESP